MKNKILISILLLCAIVSFAGPNLQNRPNKMRRKDIRAEVTTVINSDGTTNQIKSVVPILLTPQEGALISTAITDRLILSGIVTNLSGVKVIGFSRTVQGGYVVMFEPAH